MNARRSSEVVRAALGTRLRAVRKEAGLSQEKLGAAADLSGKFIGEVERGEKSISVDSLVRVAEALELTIAELLEGVSPGRRRAADPEVERTIAVIRRLAPAKARTVRRIVAAAVGQ